MIKRMLKSLTVCFLALSLMTPHAISSDYIPQEEPVVEVITVERPVVVEEVVEVEPVQEEPELPLTEEEIYLVALVTMAEAEGEPEEGKRLVIDTILNRTDSDYSYWPDTVSEVIYQPSQFTSMWNGRADKCQVTDDILELVKEELLSRTNNDVVFFRTSHYSSYGTPMFQVGNHYFSSL